MVEAIGARDHPAQLDRPRPGLQRPRQALTRVALLQFSAFDVDQGFAHRQFDPALRRVTLRHRDLEQRLGVGQRRFELPAGELGQAGERAGGADVSPLADLGGGQPDSGQEVARGLGGDRGEGLAAAHRRDQVGDLAGRQVLDRQLRAGREEPGRTGDLRPRRQGLDGQPGGGGDRGQRPVGRGREGDARQFDHRQRIEHLRRFHVRQQLGHTALPQQALGQRFERFAGQQRDFRRRQLRGRLADHRGAKFPPGGVLVFVGSVGERKGGADPQQRVAELRDVGGGRLGAEGRRHFQFLPRGDRLSRRQRLQQRLVCGSAGDRLRVPLGVGNRGVSLVAHPAGGRDEVAVAAEIGARFGCEQSAGAQQPPARRQLGHLF